MRLLALDAAAGRCSVALMLDAAVNERSVEPGKAHTEDLLRLTGELLAEAGIGLADLDGIACSIGPGAFTGVRVTVSVAQGLAFGSERPVVAVNTLEALALQLLPGQERVFACLDARMGEVYVACFGRDQEAPLRVLSEPGLSLPQDVKLPAGRFAGIGQGISAYPELVRAHDLVMLPGAESAMPRAREIAQLGAVRLGAGGGMNPKDLEPLYLRDKVAYTSAERAGR
ncbi:MAG TPA: tRNA (adenosine(37)-N6)-threonylcarbamoyltransferase complex dimerization subunit type 1 TsaB [Steroidobacteraceae bacterium]|jgi:tRNA threonylcarbamoyladenosine biosynthesis protein TsaB